MELSDKFHIISNLNFEKLHILRGQSCSVTSTHAQTCTVVWTGKTSIWKKLGICMTMLGLCLTMLGHCWLMLGPYLTMLGHFAAISGHPVPILAQCSTFLGYYQPMMGYCLTIIQSLVMLGCWGIILTISGKVGMLGNNTENLW